MKHMTNGYAIVPSRLYSRLNCPSFHRRFHVVEMANGDAKIRKIRSDKGKHRTSETIRATVQRPYVTRVPRRVLWRKKLNKILAGILGLLIVANVIWGMDMADPRANPNEVRWERKETVFNVAPALAKEEPKVETVEDKIRNVFGDDAEWAIRCFRSESGLRPNAIGINRNGTKDVGVAQVHTPLHCSKAGTTNLSECIARLQDVDTNLKVAKQIFDGRGSRAWYGKKCN